MYYSYCIFIDQCNKSTETEIMMVYNTVQLCDKPHANMFAT